MIVSRSLLTILAVFCMNSVLFAQNQRREKKAPPPAVDTQCAPTSNYMRPDCALSDQMPAAYNTSARIDPANGYDVFLDASFIYWYTGQEYMDIGRTALFNPDINDLAPTPPANAAVAMQTFEYQPGFKVGLGFGTEFDNWQFALEYTYLHNSKTYSTGSSAAAFNEGDEILVPNEWFINLSTNITQQAGRMTSKWKMHLDMVDGLLSRPFYQGQRLNLNPYTGLKALWVRQTFDVNAFLTSDPAAAPVFSDNRSRAWALGPTIGANLNWLLGMGFRFEFDAGFSLLYTRYTTLKHREGGFSVANVNVGSDPLNGEAPTRGYLRTYSELGLGLGWGSYFCNKRYHVDFSARYDFALLPNQNMMRYTVGALANNTYGYSNPIGDLYLHGLTLTGRFDF